MIKKIHYILALILFLISSSVSSWAQLHLEWSKQIGDINHDYISDLTIDTKNNI